MSMILDGTITFGDSTVQLASANTFAMGVGQTWQDVTASRAGGSTYTNSTGKPITVIVSINQTGSYVVDYTVTVGGVAISRVYAATATQQTTAYLPTTFIVPPGATYLVTISVGVLYRWAELR